LSFASSQKTFELCGSRTEPNPGVGSANKFTDLVLEFHNGERLIDVTIAALVYTALEIRLMEQRRCCEDRDILGLRVGAKTSHRPQPSITGIIISISINLGCSTMAFSKTS
jgi:hypothetical protein